MARPVVGVQALACLTQPKGCTPRDISKRLRHTAGLVITVWCALGASVVQAEQTDAARDVLKRLIGERAAEFRFDLIAKDHERDIFEIAAVDGHVTVRGSSGVAMCRGAYEYLKRACDVHISWDGNRLDLPQRFPDIEETRVVCPHRYVHYFNQCTFSYTMPWWDWERWEREIDWMALHGINMPLAMTGQEVVWQRVWKEYGLSDADLAKFFSGPAYLPFFHMGCLYAHEGPLPQSWIERQCQLQKRILERERSLGMTPVTQAFAGFVPPAFAKAHPELDILHGQPWCGFEPTLILNPREPMFVEIGKRFLKEYIREYGTDHLYMSDTFIEMKPTFDEKTRLADLANMGDGVYRGIAEADPDGVWVMMGWPFLVFPDFWGEDEIAAMFRKVPDDRLILLDLAIEANPMWRQRRAFRERQWISSIIHNYGQNTAMYGILPFAASAQHEVVTSPDRGKHIGAGITPEGIEQNAVLYELEADAIWHDKPIDLTAWLQDYARRRYGACPEAMTGAWNILGETIYDLDISDEGNSNIGELVPCTFRQPSLSYRSTRELGDPKRLRAVADHFLSCAPELGGCDLYRRDLVDLVKQFIVIGDRRLVENINAAHVSGNMKRRDALIDEYLQMINDLDRLVATRSEYHLSRWIQSARAIGKDPIQADFYERNARRLVTRWDNHGNLSDYAWKEWSGLLSGYYGVRWRMLFDRLRAAGEGPFDAQAVSADIAAWEETWVASTAPVKENKTGNEIRIAQEMLSRYRNWPEQWERQGTGE